MRAIDKLQYMHHKKGAAGTENNTEKQTKTGGKKNGRSTDPGVDIHGQSDGIQK